jgi:hypothetical protein
MRLPKLPRLHIGTYKRLLGGGLAGKLGAGLAVVVLVSSIALTLHLAHRGSSTTTAQQPQLASGPATATVDQTVVATTAGTTTASTATVTSPTPPGSSTTATIPTATTNTERNDVRVTQNQDMRPPCTNDTPPSFTVQLSNSGAWTVGWQVAFPAIYAANPYWGSANPNSGSLAPGQSADFVVTFLWGLMPCGGDIDHASVKLSYPSGNWQPDLPLTYTGAGPVPASHVVLVSGQLANTESCPASGTAPAPFTFAIQNTGNAIAYPSIDIKDNVGPNYWANSSVVLNPPNPPVQTWLYPGETWTITVSPRAGVQCNGTVYHVYININDQRAPSVTMTLTDTFS